MDDQYRGSDDIPFEWDQRLIKTASDAAAYHTRRISQRRGLNPSDRDDLRQDILLALLTRAHRYDQLRGATATFVKVLTRHAVVDQARAALTSSRLIDAEAKVPDIAASLEQEDYLICCIDLARTMAELAPALVDIVTLIAQHGSAAEAHRASALPLCTFYRWLSEVRMRLRAGGLAPTP